MKAKCLHIYLRLQINHVFTARQHSLLCLWTRCPARYCRHVYLSVRPFVCPSHAVIVSKRSKLGSRHLCWRVATSLVVVSAISRRGCSVTPSVRLWYYGSSPKISGRYVVVTRLTTELVEPWRCYYIGVHGRAICFEYGLDNVSSLDQEDDQVMGRCGIAKLDELMCIRRVSLSDRMQFRRRMITPTQGWDQLSRWLPCCGCGPTGGLWLFVVGISCGKLPNALSRQQVMSVAQPLLRN